MVSKLPAHLLTHVGQKACSLCGKVFPKDIQPSLGKAFAEHVREAHQGKNDDSQAEPEIR
jgi:hypothetical protein